jgi:hypothetical protein
VDADRRLVAVEVQTDTAFRIVQRQTLFAVPPGNLVSGISDFYDIAPDDQRFLMGRSFALGGDNGSYVLVQNWFEELKQRMGN